MPKCYKIHDNGGVPFVVGLARNEATVYSQMYDEEKKKYVKEKELFSVPYTRAFIGDNKLGVKGYVQKGKYKGNTILLHLDKNDYIFIGSEILKFKTSDSANILDYFSPVGNSDVPYPYAISETKVYLLDDKVVLPVEMIDVKKDAYEQYYRLQNQSAQSKKMVKKSSSKIKAKTLVKRKF